MNKANIMKSKSAKRWQNKGHCNRASDAGGMQYVLHGVFLREQNGNRPARNKLYPFSHTQSRPLHISRSLNMQNELMSA